MAADRELDLHGVIPPLVTPIDADGEVDRRSLERLIAFQLDAGVSGLFVGGSTGEVALLDGARLDTALEITVSAVSGAVPVLAGAVDTGTLRVIERARRASRLGADGVVVTSPFYIAPHEAEIVEHFRLVHAAVNRPVVAYDIPTAVGTHLSPAVVAELAESKFAVGLKDSSGNLTSFREILRRTNGFPVLTGSELLADTALSLGASGLVPGLGNIDPHGYVRLHDAMRNGDTERAAAEQDRLARLFRITEVGDRRRIGVTAAALGSFKAALALRGIIGDPATNPPLLPLDPEETRAIGRILAEAELGEI